MAAKKDTTKAPKMTPAYAQAVAEKLNTPEKVATAKLVAALVKAGRSIAQVAAVAGTSPGAVYMWKKGIRAASILQLATLKGELERAKKGAPPAAPKAPAKKAKTYPAEIDGKATSVTIPDRDDEPGAAAAEIAPGGACEVFSFGRWYPAELVKAYRTNVAVRYTTGSGTTRTKRFPADRVRPMVIDVTIDRGQAKQAAEAAADAEGIAEFIDAELTGPAPAPTRAERDAATAERFADQAAVVAIIEAKDAAQAAKKAAAEAAAAAPKAGSVVVKGPEALRRLDRLLRLAEALESSGQMRFDF
jgi:hypothetical protein